MLLSIGELAEKTGVTVGTLRAWEKAGKIKSFRTKGNHRRYSEFETRIKCEDELPKPYDPVEDKLAAPWSEKEREPLKKLMALPVETLAQSITMHRRECPICAR